RPGAGSGAGAGLAGGGTPAAPGFARRQARRVGQLVPGSDEGPRPCAAQRRRPRPGGAQPRLLRPTGRDGRGRLDDPSGTGVAAAVSESLGLFTNKVDGVFQRSVIEGAREVVERAGLGFTIHELAEPPQRAEPVLELVAPARGSLVLANVLGDVALTGLVNTAHAVTLVSHRTPALAVPAVLHDNRQGMRQLLEHLVDAGRRSFAYVG